MYVEYIYKSFRQDKTQSQFFSQVEQFWFQCFTSPRLAA